MLIFACQSGRIVDSAIPPEPPSQHGPPAHVSSSFPGEIDAHACFKPARSSGRPQCKFEVIYATVNTYFCLSGGFDSPPQCKFWVIYPTVNTYFCLSGGFDDDSPPPYCILRTEPCNFIVFWAVYALEYLFLLGRVPATPPLHSIQ